MASTVTSSTPDPTHSPEGFDSCQRVAWWRERPELLRQRLGRAGALTWVDVRVVTVVEGVDADLRDLCNRSE